MSRYIDADRFEKWLSVKFSEGLIDLKTAENAASVLKYAPTADVKPVVHGEWLTYDRKELIPTGKISIDEHGNPYKVRKWGIIHWFRCSNCKYVEEVKTPFCCECGADMRGEHNDK